MRASVELCKNIPDLEIIEIRGFYFMPQKLLNLIVDGYMFLMYCKGNMALIFLKGPVSSFHTKIEGGI